MLPKQVSYYRGWNSRLASNEARTSAMTITITVRKRISFMRFASIAGPYIENATVLREEFLILVILRSERICHI